MYLFNKHLYYVYIVTNPERSVLYIGMTNNLGRRLEEHYANRGNSKSFAGKYYFYGFIYYEEFQYVTDAMAREKELKGWRREKKENLIRTKNRDMTFLNALFCIHWPPKKVVKRF